MTLASSKHATQGFAGISIAVIAGLAFLSLIEGSASFAQTLAPARRHLAQTTSPPRFGELTYNSVRDNRFWDISLMDVATQTVRRISRQPFTVIAWDWNYDGSRIAFVTDRDGNMEIYTMDANGGDWRRITNTPGADYGPMWSPDGRQIAYGEDLGGGLIHLFLANAEGTHRVQLTSGPGGGYSPVWSPDGARIAYVANQTLMVSNRDGSNPSRLFTDSNEKMPCDWSPTGTHILFMKRQNGIFKLFTYRLSDGVVTAVPTGEYDAWSGSWSPDGTMMAFYSYGIGSVGFPGMFAVFLMNADSSNLRQITTLTDNDRSWHPSWRP